jgi:hypothetical protein
MEDFLIHHNDDGSISITNFLGQTVTKPPPFLKSRNSKVYREKYILKKKSEEIVN